MKTVILLNAAMWLAVGTAITVAIVITGNVKALWFFIIPMLSGYSFTETTKKENQ